MLLSRYIVRIQVFLEKNFLCVRKYRGRLSVLISVYDETILCVKSLFPFSGVFLRTEFFICENTSFTSQRTNADLVPCESCTTLTACRKVPSQSTTLPYVDTVAVAVDGKSVQKCTGAGFNTSS
ncbi:hypothetical protein RF11_01326 [Thelohanellus kitauei]|uniref:Uncharacterized protein n=1 Tax=Thelohanellus kitauei TaxID=669202 RepID=A0A0C2MRW6_THEKT|nr:hypothetical protein RF11_01326 [Thelohanellus kitauei]